MNERLIPFASFYLDAQADADGVNGVYVPEAILFTHISKFVTNAGAPGTADIDIQDDGTDIVTASSILSASASVLTELATPVRLAAASVVELDLNHSGGTTPTTTGEIVLWGFVSE
jgi:hypothetical protein